jgi:hypothetical protein
MSCFNKELFIQLNPSLPINQDEKDLLDSLVGKRCIVADNYVRHPGVHNFTRNPNPHLKHHTTGMLKPDIHNCIYLCNYLFHALHKYRSAKDRKRWYNIGRGLWSGSCYLYIVRSENVNRSGLVDVGLGLGQSPGLESFGKSPIPVQYNGC